eukprot:scaffold43859_cov50-Phaeocystis_antarctica.AAC.1
MTHDESPATTTYPLPTYSITTYLLDYYLLLTTHSLHGRLPYPNASSFMSQMHMVTKGDAPTPPEGSSEEVHGA